MIDRHRAAGRAPAEAECRAVAAFGSARLVARAFADASPSPLERAGRLARRISRLVGRVAGALPIVTAGTRRGKMSSTSAARCSFCGKHRDQVGRLIAGSHLVFICDQRVALCNEILAREKNPSPACTVCRHRWTSSQKAARA